VELEDPVEDEKGYIYDRAAITSFIRTQGGPEGWCEAPFPGAAPPRRRSAACHGAW
jgi:hypothetical protein